MSTSPGPGPRTSSDPALAEFEAERDRLSLITRKGIGMPAAGMLYWLGVAVLVQVFPQKTALVYSFALTGVVFPIGALLTRLAGGDLFAKSPTFTPLGLQLAAVQLFYWPILIVVFNAAPRWTPFTMAVLFGSHFLPYSWLYRSRGYAFLAIATAGVMTVGMFATRSPMYATAPLLAAGCYAVAVAMLWGEVGELTRKERTA
jgi:formate/nitrite transporter FocA (FNT family)